MDIKSDTICKWNNEKDVYSNMIKNLSNEWLDFFKKDDINEMLNETICKICEEQEKFENYLSIFPTPDNVFNSIINLPPQKIKAIILGQDPYHQPNQAMGLSFSVPKNVKIPPSLVNIYKELSNDLNEWEIPTHGDLTNWKEENVLLLNSSLTVLESKPMRHMKYWKPITDKMIEYISDFNNYKVFMLWGNSSKAKKSLIKD